MRFHSAACIAALSISASTDTTSAFTFSPSLVNKPSTISRNSVNNVAITQQQQRPAFGLPSVSTSNSLINTNFQSTTSLNLAAGGGPEALQDYIATLSNTNDSKITSKLNNPKLVKE